MSTAATVQPSTTQLIEAFASALLPLAGPYGVAADAVITAGLQFLANLQAGRQPGAANFTMDDLEAAAFKATTDLGQLEADVKGLPT